jgi:hypothetical protein
MSNEQQTSLWFTKEKRIAMFKQRMDGEIGKEFYVEMPKEEWCGINHCIQLDKTTTEYVLKRDPSTQCVMAWVVDTTGSKGNYQHPPGPVFYSLGIRKSWRYLSKPELCYETINYNGPW